MTPKRGAILNEVIDLMDPSLGHGMLISSGLPFAPSVLDVSIRFPNLHAFEDLISWHDIPNRNPSSEICISY
jgi:hypothetical protein